MRRAVFFLCWIMTVGPATAQEFTIFDIDDFVDPRELGATVGADGSLTCPCTTLFIARAMAGYDHNFLNVMQPTNFDVAFGHIAMSAYFNGKWQVNLKQSFLYGLRELKKADRPSGALPKGSLSLQIGRYDSTPIEKTDDEGSPIDRDGVAIGRTQFTWRITRYLESRPGDPPRNVQTLRHEFSYEVDVDVKDFIGSISYTLLADPDDDSDWLHRPARLAVAYRFAARKLGPSRIEPTFTFGWLGRGILPGSRFTVQPAARLVVPLGRGNTQLNVRIAPTMQRLEGWKSYLEVAAFVEAPVFTTSF
jgi:hypothetical protein